MAEPYLFSKTVVASDAHFCVSAGQFIDSDDRKCCDGFMKAVRSKGYFCDNPLCSSARSEYVDAGDLVQHWRVHHNLYAGRGVDSRDKVERCLDAAERLMEDHQLIPGARF
jgi:hypothetical protein